MLAKRMVASFHARNNSILSSVAHLSVDVLTNPYWAVKPTPLLCNAFTAISSDLTWIRQSDKPYKFKIDYNIFQEPIAVSSLPQSAYSTNESAKLFLANLLERKYPNATCIYTDGSVNMGGVGCSFFDPQANVKRQFRMWDESSIYSAEAYAIQVALKYVLDTGGAESSLIIISDSQSVLMKVKSANPSKKMSFLEAEILRLVGLLRATGVQSRFIWIRGHHGIPGSTTADSLAKEATLLPLRQLSVFPASDLNRSIKLQLREDWRQMHINYHAVRIETADEVDGEIALTLMPARPPPEDNTTILKFFCKL
ncbi:hypothetical protein GE061_018963 [Apolygus lucorum]|uniref:RNase H type-1 domain-containing protein n=1 Tax=Apolygus lucorum TaxID=248454 RepID=A0A8S9X916_APOLU|nr:hypothetical protein GE061_018963 [Apolygus lucorum]